jgi:hypothetical protein
VSSGRTSFVPKDIGFYRREKVVEAGLRYGPLATTILDWLICEAKAQNPTPVSEGRLKTGYAAIRHGATFGHHDLEEVRAVVATLVEVGLLDDFDETGHTFTCRISGWKQDVVDKLEAQRKREARANADISDDDGQRATASADVRKRPETSSTPQDRTADQRPAGARPVKFGGRPVPQPLLVAAEQVLAVFNRKAGTGYRPLTSDGKPSQNLSRILGAMTRDERVTAEIAGRMIEQALSQPRPFWGDSTPHLGHVFGPNVVEANLERALHTNGIPAGELEAFRAHKAALAERNGGEHA